MRILFLLLLVAGLVGCESQTNNYKVKEIRVSSMTHRITNGSVPPQYQEESTATWVVAEKDQAKLLEVMRAAKVNGMVSLYDYALVIVNKDADRLKEIEAAKKDEPLPSGAGWSELTIEFEPSGSIELNSAGPDVEGASELWEMLKANSEYSTRSLNPDGPTIDEVKPAEDLEPAEKPESETK